MDKPQDKKLQAKKTQAKKSEKPAAQKPPIARPRAEGLQLVKQQALAALVGGESLMGREIRDVCQTEGFPARLKMVEAGEDPVVLLNESEGEPVVIGRLDRYTLGEADVAFLAGTPESARQALVLDVDTALVDLTGATEEDPRARVRAPMVEPAGFSVPKGAVHVIAHPAAIAMTLVLNRLHLHNPIVRTVATVLEPASERGREGVDEMQQQVVGMLSFKGIPKKVFDAQVAFNLLARYGEEAPHSLEDAELRIGRHLTTLLGQSSLAPAPSLKLIQAPVFHGHSILMWIQFERNPEPRAIEKTLHSDDIDVRGGDHDPPDVVGIAGSPGIAAGNVKVDRNEPRACWLWLVADNMRLAAQNAVAVARQLL